MGFRSPKTSSKNDEAYLPEGNTTLTGVDLWYSEDELGAYNTVEALNQGRRSGIPVADSVYPPAPLDYAR